MTPHTGFRAFAQAPRPGQIRRGLRVAGCVIASVVAASSLVATATGAQTPCLRFDSSWWQLGATRFFQGSGEGQRSTGIGLERHFVDRRVLRRSGSGYRLEIARVKLGLRDTSVNITVDYAPNGAVTRIAGDTGSLSHDVSQLLVQRCAELQPGRSVADLGARVDTVRTQVQRSVTRVTPARTLQVGPPVDTLRQTLAVVTAHRSVVDTSAGVMLRQMPNQVADTVRPWTLLTGDERERLLLRGSDGFVVFRERTRTLVGRGWVPPHPVGDTVPIRVEFASVERVVDSAVAAQILSFPRRGEMTVSGTTRDTVALHWREWRGDTLIVRQVRRSGWRDELRTVWKDSALVAATLIEPGTATQETGPFRRQFTVSRGYLRDAGSKDSLNATPTHPWAIALDGFEDALVPALLAIPADSQPHRFSMYGLGPDRGSWLNWSVTITQRGKIRVARFNTLQKQWVGTFVFTPTGELLLATLGGPAGVARLPASDTRLAALLDAQKGNIRREDLLPTPP